MPEGKKSDQRLEFLESKLRIVDLIQDRQLAAMVKIENQVKALEEAICPRVAARLTALERAVGKDVEAPPTTTKPQGTAGRPSCTLGQIDAVARKINKIMGAPEWMNQEPEARDFHRRLAHKIIHAVQEVMG